MFSGIPCQLELSTYSYLEHQLLSIVTRFEGVENGWQRVTIEFD